MNTKENNYGIYVGMELPAEVITEWAKSGYNYTNPLLDKFKKANGGFYGDRQIVLIKENYGVVSFLVSGSIGAYLRAEGFKEFLESKQVGNNFMSDYIVGKKYRLLELHPIDAFKDDGYEGTIIIPTGRTGYFFSEKKEEERFFVFLDGYPKIELVEDNFKRTFKKHYRFKNREYLKLHP